jgi:hypothetical protein
MKDKKNPYGENAPPEQDTGQKTTRDLGAKPEEQRRRKRQGAGEPPKREGKSRDGR